MAISRVSGQVVGNNENDGVLSVTFPGDVTAGNLVVILAGGYQVGGITVGDVTKTGGTATIGTVTLDRDYTNGDFDSAVLSVPVTGTGTLTITYNSGNTTQGVCLSAVEYTGADVSGTRLEDSDQGSGASGAPATANMTSAGAAVFVGMVTTDTPGTVTHTPGGDYTQIAEYEAGATGFTYNSCDRIVGSGTTDAVDWSAPTTVPWTAVGAVYKAVVAAGGRNPVSMGFELR